MNYTKEDVETRFIDIGGHGQFTLDELSNMIDMFRHPGWLAYLKWTKAVQLNCGSASLINEMSIEGWRRLQGASSQINEILTFEQSVTDSRTVLAEKRKKMLDENKQR